MEIVKEYVLRPTAKNPLTNCNGEHDMVVGVVSPLFPNIRYVMSWW
jgi:hypothetical protein